VEYKAIHLPLNHIVINNAWEKSENRIHISENFIRNVSHTPENLLRQDIEEPNFELGA